MRLPLALLSLGALLLLSTPALAQSEARDPAVDTPPEALAAFREARALYQAGRYPQAAAALERAFALDPASPTLAYNLARVYELMGELDRALDYYRRYEALLPNEQARELERASATIERLEGARAQRRPDAPPTTAPPPREVQALRELPGLVLVREAGVADTAFWLTLGGGVLLLAAGLTFGLLALDRHGAAESFTLGVDGDSPSQRDDLYDRAEAFALVSDVTLALGGALVLSSGLLYFLRQHTVERVPVGAPEAGATLELSPRRVLLTVRGVL